jgi:hypothetical protein
MKVHDHLCRNPAGVPRKVGKHVRIVLARSREVAEHPRVSAPELAPLCGKGTRSAIWAAGHGRVEIKDIRGLSTIAQLFQSVRLEGFAVEQVGGQFARVQRLPVQSFTIARLCKQKSGCCHPPVN